MSKDIWLLANEEARERLMEEHALDDEEDIDEEELDKLTEELYEDRIGELYDKAKHLQDRYL